MACLDRVYHLPAFSELRILTSTSPKDVATVLLHVPARDDGGDSDGSFVPRADILGTELVPGVSVLLPMSRSVAVFTPTGCTLTIKAPPSVLQRCYATTSGAVWMRSILGLHSHLEVQRMEAKATGADMGPRVLIVGEERHVGTSTYARMLSAYAVRLGYHPLLLDCSVDHPQFGYPGCLSMLHLQYTLDVEEDASFYPAVHIFAGGNRTKDHEDLFLHGVRELMNLGMEKMARNDRCRVGGLFLDYGTVSSTSVETAERDSERARLGKLNEESTRANLASNPLDVLLDTIIEADIDHVLVVQSGWLRHKLAQRAQERFTLTGHSQPPPADDACMLTAPMEIASEKSAVAFKLFLVDGLDYVNSYPAASLRHQRWMHYFFGSVMSNVKPTLVKLETAAIRIALVGSSQQSALSTLMPMMDEGTGEDGGADGRDGRAQDGAARRLDPPAVNFVTAQDVELKGRILGISSATEMEQLPDGSLRRVPYAEFENRVRQCVLLGFALVESATPSTITLLLNDVPLHKDLGVCLVLTDEYLKKSS